MPTDCSAPIPAGCAPAGVTDQRVLDTFTRRFNAATRQAKVPLPAHTANTDETHYADKCGTYCKCLPQSAPGIANPTDFTAFRNAINKGELDPFGAFHDFEHLTLGGTRTHNGPMGSYAYQFMGADGSQFGIPSVPPAPALASEEYATELIELYWCSLMRDVNFTEYATNSIAADAAAELTTAVDYRGPKDAAGNVTPALLFRGGFQGETVGPYLSQFLITPTRFGAQPFSQQYITYAPGVDFMTDLADWFAVQQGKATSAVEPEVAAPSYLRNGRGLAAYTHVDELFQAYFTAHLVLEQLNNSRLASDKVPLINPGNPYVGSKTQNGFGTFGGADFPAMIAQVAKAALNAVWYQKWVIHLRHRPEAGGGLVHLINSGKTFDGSPHASVFSSNALAQSHAKYGTWLLSQAFPEGSPSHPAYPTGHGAVGGACITLLKFFYNGDYVLTNPQVPTADGSARVPWDFNPASGEPGPLTVNGELNKLARNITFGHGLHGGIHWRTDSEASMLLGEAVALQFLQDLACTYPEPFRIKITGLNGATHTIANH